MAFLRMLVAVFLLIYLVPSSTSNEEEIFSTYFNEFCYWSEEISYHVHYLSGCKVHFTCHRGQFVEFKKCPESTVFNTETLRCDTDAVCRDRRNKNPTYQAFWKTVNVVIDTVLEALGSSLKKNATKTELPQKVLDKSAVVLPSSTISPQVLLKTKDLLRENIGASDEVMLENTENDLKIRGSLSLSTETKSTSDRTEIFDSSILIASTPSVKNKLSHSTASQPKTEHMSIHMVSMQFDTQASLLPESFSSYVTPKPVLNEDILKAIDQLRSLGVLSFPQELNREQNFKNDFILPIVKSIVTNTKIMSKVSQLFDVVFKSSGPLLYQIFDQKVSEELGSTIRITSKELKDTWNLTMRLASPILREIVLLSVSPVLHTISDNADIFLDYMDRDEIGLFENFSSTWGALFKFIMKYRLFYLNSESEQFITYSLIEIRKDMQNLVEGFAKNV